MCSRCNSLTWHTHVINHLQTKHSMADWERCVCMIVVPSLQSAMCKGLCKRHRITQDRVFVNFLGNWVARLGMVMLALMLIGVSLYDSCTCCTHADSIGYNMAGDESNLLVYT